MSIVKSSKNGGLSGVLKIALIDSKSDNGTIELKPKLKVYLDYYNLNAFSSTSPSSELIYSSCGSNLLAKPKQDDLVFWEYASHATVVTLPELFN